MSQASLRIGVVVAALVHLAAPAHADAGDGDGADAGGADDAAGTPASVTPSEQARSRARVLLDAGNQLMDAGDHLGALELYRQAHAAYPSPRLRVAMGTSLWNLGRYTEAAEAFEEALASAELDAALRAELLARLAELARSIAVITITIDAAGGDGAAAERLARASLVVDGRHVPLVDGRAAVRVDPGAHVILVEAPGSPPWTGTVELAPGEQRPLGVDLEALPVIAPRVVERLVVRAPTLRGTGARLGASAEVLVDLAGPGAAVALDARWGATAWLDLTGGLVVGGHLAVHGAAIAYLGETRLRPSVALGLVVFAADGPRPGARAAAGLEWRASDRIAVTLQLGVEHYPWVPDDFVTTLWAPAVGVVARR